jgi:hypothetical protein
MVRSLVNWLLGPWGRDVLAFYVANSLWINTAIVLYGIVLTAAHLNLRRLDRAVQPYRGQDGAAPPDEAFWEGIIQTTSFLPLIAGPRSLWPQRTTVDNLRRLSRPTAARPPAHPTEDA